MAVAQPTTDYYEVENGVTRLIRKTIIHQAPTNKFAELLARPRDNNILYLPAQTRHVFGNGDTGRTTFVIEQPPSVRKLTWAPQARRHASYELAIPWTYFVMITAKADPDDPNSQQHMSDWSIFCAKQRIMSLDDTLTTMPVNNVNTDGRICFGTAAAEAGENIGQHIDNLVMTFWNSNFNYDITPRLPGYADYAEWEKDSKLDPVCWMKWDWNNWGAYTTKLREISGMTDDRLTPAIALDPIPELPIGPTFGRATEWLQSLSEADRTRLIAAAQALA